MIKIGVVWRKEKDGKVFYSGKTDTPCPIILNDEMDILLWRNKTKEAGNEQAPDFDVLIGKPRSKSEGGTNGKPVEL